MYYDILKASKVKAEVFPDYWTLLWGRKLSESMIKTLTGTLPLTFTARGGNMADWVISGNDGVGKNLLPSAVNGTYTSGRGTVICNNGVYTFKISAGTGSVSIIVPIPEFTIPVSVGQGGNGVLYFLNDKATSEIAIPFTYNGSSVMSNYTPLSVNRVINDYGTTETKQCNGIQFFAANSVGDYEITISPMFITDGTAPDHYIPYQQGVGERTANLFDVSKFEDGNTHVSASGLSLDIGNQTVIINQTSTAQYPQAYITDSNGQALQLQESETYSIKIDKQNVPEGSHIYVILRAKSSGTERPYDTVVNQKIVTIPSGLSNWRWLLVVEGNNIIYDNCTVRIDVRKSNDVPSTYIPYGYEIPISVNNTPQTFYIGDSPLTAGQSISKTSTGVDIAAQVGANTISTDLYNKPEVEIKYK